MLANLSLSFYHLRFNLLLIVLRLFLRTLRGLARRTAFGEACLNLALSSDSDITLATKPDLRFLRIDFTISNLVLPERAGIAPFQVFEPLLLTRIKYLTIFGHQKIK